MQYHSCQFCSCAINTWISINVSSLSFLVSCSSILYFYSYIHHILVVLLYSYVLLESSHLLSYVIFKCLYLFVLLLFFGFVPNTFVVGGNLFNHVAALLNNTFFGLRQAVTDSCSWYVDLFQEGACSVLSLVLKEVHMFVKESKGNNQINHNEQ